MRQVEIDAPIESLFDLDLIINKNPPPPVLRRPDAGPIRPQRDESRVLVCDPLSKDGSDFPGAHRVQQVAQPLGNRQVAFQPRGLGDADGPVQRGR